MDIFGKLVQGGGCTADGTVAAGSSKNPLNKLFDSITQSSDLAGAAQHPAQANTPMPGARQLDDLEEQMRFAHEQAAEGIAAMDYARTVHPHQTRENTQEFLSKYHENSSDQWSMQYLDTMRNVDGSDRPAVGLVTNSNDQWSSEYVAANAHPYGHQDVQPFWVPVHQEQQAYNEGFASEAASSVVHAMNANSDPRWKNSEFLKYMHQLSANDAISSDVEDKVQPDVAASNLNGSLTGDNIEKELEEIWQRAIAATKTTDPFEDIWRTDENLHTHPEYAFAKENKYMNHGDAFEEGMQLFHEGEITQAILAFEAELKSNADNSEAWRMLGECHAENDEDKKAIICLERAVEHDAYNLSAVLALGVSYVNELQPRQALNTLKTWVKNNPKFHGFEIQIDEYSDGSLMDEVMQLMLQAEEFDAEDTDVQVVLGVLYNVSKDYDAAVGNFRSTVEERPEEYSLWNKLGATLANSNRSEEALPAYHRAIEIKPKYVRGWLNLGISHANLGQYDEAARCYLQALSLNPDAVHIWSYLRIAFSCIDRFDLVKKTDTRDLTLFEDEFQIHEL